VVLGVLVGTFCSFLIGLLNPAVANKAGPDWLWAGGRSDFVRNLYFRPNGAFRRFKDVLGRWPEELERWFAYSEERQRGRARTWRTDAGYYPSPGPGSSPRQ